MNREKPLKSKRTSTSAELPAEGDLEDVVMAGVLSVTIYYLVRFFKNLFRRTKESE